MLEQLNIRKAELSSRIIRGKSEESAQDSVIRTQTGQLDTANEAIKKLTEQVELSGYSASVSSYKVMSIEDFLNEYGIDKRKDISDEQDDLYVMVAECTLDITGEMKGFPYADIRLASGAFSQGVSNDYIREINKDVKFSKFEQGTSITVDIPFLIHSISFPHSINADKLNKEEWQLYFSVTPGKYVRMGK